MYTQRVRTSFSGMVGDQRPRHGVVWFPLTVVCWAMPSRETSKTVGVKEQWRATMEEEEGCPQPVSTLPRSTPVNNYSTSPPHQPSHCFHGHRVSRYKGPPRDELLYSTTHARAKTRRHSHGQRAWSFKGHLQVKNIFTTWDSPFVFQSRESSNSTFWCNALLLATKHPQRLPLSIYRPGLLRQRLKNLWYCILMEKWLKGFSFSASRKQGQTRLHSTDQNELMHWGTLPEYRINYHKIYMQRDSHINFHNLVFFIVPLIWKEKCAASAIHLPKGW